MGKVTIEKAELGCGGRCCKLLLYTFNILFLIGGLTLLVVGLWVAVSQTSLQVAAIIETNLYKAAAYLLFISGSCVVVIALIGCCGAKFENRCLIGTYFVFLLFVFIFELVAGIIALACYTQANKFIEDNMLESLQEYYGSEEPGKGSITEGWDYIQEEFECCAVHGPANESVNEYHGSKWFQERGIQRVPPSCCTKTDEERDINVMKCTELGSKDYSFINGMGCFDVIRDKVIQYATILAGLGIAVCVIQIFGMIFACCLVRQLI